MNNTNQFLAKDWWEDQDDSDGPHTDQGIVQKTSSYVQGYNKKLLIIDLLCIHLVSIPFIMCEANLVNPVHVGFFCNDNSINYPLKAPSINSTILLFISLFISIASITLGELQWIGYQLSASPELVRSTYVAVLYRELSAFLFGVTVNQSFTSIAKIISGRLRPNFLAVCRPDWAHLDCTRGYVINYNCTGDPDEVSMARKSFLSDQAAFSTYCVVYLMLYLQARLIWEWSKHLRIVLQIILLSLPLLVGYIQISDYWHHFSDVFFGFLQGMTTAIWMVFFISDTFLSKKSLLPASSSKEQSLSENTTF